MSLVDEIRSIPPDGGCCTTGSWYRQQAPEVQQAFDDYLADVVNGVRKTYTPLHEVCCKHGLKISLKPFKEHILIHSQ